MKKHFIITSALMALFMMASCSEEDMPQGQVSGDFVTFKVAVPQISTRAISDGYTANRLYWGVYDHDGRLLPEISNTDNDGKDDMSFSGSGEVKLTLAQDKKYSIVFWAANESNSMCHVDWDGRCLSVEPKEANQESYDAFCAYVKIDNVSGYKTQEVKLYRPFAQLNIGTADYAKAAASGLTVKNTRIKVSGIPVQYNFVDSTTVGDRTMSYDYPKNPVSFKDEEYPVEGYEYLAMNYILVGSDKELVTVKLSYLDDDDQEHERTYTAVPVQRNWRTNIYGNILTSETDFTVTIVPDFNKPDHNIEVWDGKTTKEPVITQDENGQEIAVVSTGSELAYVAQVLSGKIPNNARSTRAGETVDYTTMTIVLDADLDLGNEEWLPVGTTSNPFKGTFDGNGFTIHNLKVTGSNSNVGLFGVTHDGEIKNLILNNANVSGRLNVGAVAGQPYTSKYTGITVKGHVEVNGMAYVGAVGGKNAYADWTNIIVDVDKSSYVKANSVENGTAYRTYVGGVVGFNGEGGHTFKNITSNINVEGSTLDVGGLFGIAHYGNKFENCKCTGNVVNKTDDAENALQTGGIAGVWNNGGENVEFTNCSFTGKLSAPNTDNVNFYYNGLVGAPYSAAGKGQLIIDGEVAVASVEALQVAIDAAAKGETTIALYADMAGNVTEIQKPGRKLTIDGKDHSFNGYIKVHSNSNHYADAALTVKNVNFTTSVASTNFIEALEKGSERYSTNITVENCTFTATGEAVNTAVGVQIKASKNAKVIGCKANNMHSLIQAQSCDETVFLQNCTVNGKNGVAFKQVKAATVEGTTITALEYGIRFDGNTDNYGITVKNNNVTAVQPFIVRKMTGKNNTITLEGENTLTATGTDQYQIVITNGSDDAEYVMPTGTYTLTGADSYLVYPREVFVSSTQDINEALSNGQNVHLENDIAVAKSDAGSNGYGATGISQLNGGVIDGNGHNISVDAWGTWDSAINTTGGTIRNLNVTGGMRGIFVNHNSKNNDKVILENVKVNGTVYTISCDQGTNKGLEAYNSTFNGWTSYAATIGNVKFNGCSFGKGQGYAYCRPYAPTEFVNCNFAEGYELDAVAAVTFENCTIGGVALTAENLSKLVTGNIANATVK